MARSTCIYVIKQKGGEAFHGAGREAAVAYNKAARSLFGRFARVNRVRKAA